LITVAYLFCASALLVLFGLGIACHPRTGPLSFSGRCGVAYGAGAFLLAAECTLFSMARIPWSILGLGIPLAGVSGWLLWTRRSRRTTNAGVEVLPPAPLPAWIAGGLATALLAAALAGSYASSVDLVLFYGVKAVRFAQARSLDASLLGQIFFYHGAPWYPPLMPIVEAWGILVAGGMPWRFVPLISLVWLLAAAAAIGSRLRRRIGPDAGAAVGAFWTSALALSLAYSYSGGNAEPPLLYYVSVAGAWLLTDFPGESRLLPALCLAGAAFSKQEGLLAALALAAGAALRDAAQRRERPLRRCLPLFAFPLAAVGLWFSYQKVAGLHVGYAAPTSLSGVRPSLLPEVLPDLIRNLNAGTFGLSWIVPLVFLIASGKRAFRAAPGLVPAIAVMGAVIATYIGGTTVDRPLMIIRTLPRASQAALSLLILSAGTAWFAGEAEPTAIARPPLEALPNP
jgi:hypothetical protein